MNFFIRFGVHRDREVIKELRGLISGIFIPAHILSYSSNPTIMAAEYINKGYYIDPMTYIYALNNIADYVVPDKKTGESKFKPSIAKLTTDYGLSSHFTNSAYAALRPADFTDDFIDSFCEKNIILQTQKMESERGRAIKKYEKFLIKNGAEHLVKGEGGGLKPIAIIPPYFYFNDLADEWLGINKKLLAKTKEKTAGKVIPIISTNSHSLTEGLIKEYTGCDEIFIWIDDINEKTADINKLKKLVSFVKIAKERDVKVTNLYGSYFSLLLGKLGMTGVCNGIFYGEVKARVSKIGGGPPSRYYIRGIHEFFAIPTAIALLRDMRYASLLDIECKKSMALIQSDPDNIIALEVDHSKAQRHFIYTREMELNTIEQTSLADLIANLTAAHQKYSPLDEEIVKKNIDYLERWNKALEAEIEVEQDLQA
ncbi:MAG: hypothetical protein ACD_81C00100G0008 [uncultured bacterium]|uniref:Uncharacterized protein n=1 Tax=Candidatus Wolfebacteria bacterium GW2011_GWE2_44_13 TaxID=1619017 RepID=A0A0G1H6G9_9BACT|nr:MAG: hypothetical protein ACD_81C00100G0008 [uncultured bacterium]KKT42986.1 MAG: hypothetical protein UW32_C0003G0089 [Candidatus Wolfebacteria bacterium GW2011_GWE2_44_13]